MEPLREKIIHACNGLKIECPECKHSNVVDINNLTCEKCKFGLIDSIILTITENVHTNVHRECFISATMNDDEVNILIDTGSFVSAISTSMVSKLKLTNLVKPSVENQINILGVIPNQEIVFRNGIMICCDLRVIEGNHKMILIGMNTLREYKSIVDLEKLTVTFNGQTVPFN